MSRIRKVKIKIDDYQVLADPGETVLDVCRRLNIHIPTMCYNPLMDGERPGSCRLCIVAIGKGDRIYFREACKTPVRSGLEVHTYSKEIHLLRRDIVEFLLARHRRNCWDCPVSGNCPFVELCRDYDVELLTVCAECPLHGEDCLLSKGEVCLGPLTYFGCGASCTRQGQWCFGCRGLVPHEDIIKSAVEVYREKNIPLEAVVERMELFSYSSEVIEKFKKFAGVKE